MIIFILKNALSFFKFCNQRSIRTRPKNFRLKTRLIQTPF
ncbi:hypothetical protein HMPREF1434_01632 [Helicobacter pylori GAMchJs124i]|nr:hypothetical protein HMPREF1434_01632 [Helicobacter pylori GAMchJs124i]